jgi:hypothetical protein
MSAVLQSAPNRALTPHFARHEGVWRGVYRYFDADARQIDEHRSVLVCRFPAKGGFGYFQTNYYTWADGRTETRHFPADIRDSRLIWRGDLIEGWAAEVSLDAFGRTSMLHWTRRHEPGIYVYEMIHLSDCAQYRSRVWQWFHDGRLIKRTLIDEQKVSDDWSAYAVPESFS